MNDCRQYVTNKQKQLIPWMLAASFVVASGAFAQEVPADYVQPVHGPRQKIPMVWVKGGQLWVASFTPREREPGSELRTKVAVDGFWIGKYEVRYEEFAAWAADMARQEDQLATRLADLNQGYGLNHAMLDARPDRAERPATGMNHWSAKRFCHWLSIRSGYFYRLPTEAEWEHACRAGGPPLAVFPWGDDAGRLEEFAVIGPDAEDARCSRVSQRLPNAFGLFDMLGNVEEWVADGFDEHRIGRTASLNPIIWPVSDRVSGSARELRHELLSRKQAFVASFGVAKGGTGLASRPRGWRAFTISARTNPTAYDEGDGIAAHQDEPREMSYTMAPAIGFRICSA